MTRINFSNILNIKTRTKTAINLGNEHNQVLLRTLKIMQEESICLQSEYNGNLMRQLMQELADETGLLGPVRQIGSLVAAELTGKADTPRGGYQLYREAVKHGALLRPLGNTVYWMPPLNTPTEVLHELQKITLKALNQLRRSA